jgi:hypothetical protein
MASFINLRKVLHTRNSSEDKKVFSMHRREYTVKDHYESSLISNKSDIINLIDPKKLELPLPEFKQYVIDIMKEYKTKKFKDSDDELLDDDSAIMDPPYQKNNNFKTEKYLIEKELHKNNKSILNGSTDMSILKVNVKKQIFQNPYESLDTINENAKICNSIVGRYVERQQHLFNKAYDRLIRYSKNKVKMPKVKITSVIRPIDIIRQDIKEEKKQDGDKVKLYDLSNPFIVEKQCPKLFCSYTYSNKNFPEGREQFAFVFNAEDIILYSGLSSNKNNYVWSLNPGIFILI